MIFAIIGLHLVKIVSVIKECNNHTLQTNPRHHEDESQNNNSHNTSGSQLKLSNQLSLPQDDCKTRKDTINVRESPQNRLVSSVRADLSIYCHGISIKNATSMGTKILFCIDRKIKDKDKEVLFNDAYNVTDNISSRAILRHNI